MSTPRTRLLLLTHTKSLCARGTLASIVLVYATQPVTLRAPCRPSLLIRRKRNLLGQVRTPSLEDIRVYVIRSFPILPSLE